MPKIDIRAKIDNYCNCKCNVLINRSWKTVEIDETALAQLKLDKNIEIRPAAMTVEPSPSEGPKPEIETAGAARTKKQGGEGKKKTAKKAK